MTKGVHTRLSCPSSSNFLQIGRVSSLYVLKRLMMDSSLSSTRPLVSARWRSRSRRTDSAHSRNRQHFEDADSRICGGGGDIDIGIGIDTGVMRNVVVVVVVENNLHKLRRQVLKVIGQDRVVLSLNCCE